MPMQLNLPPELEAFVRAAAARAGVTVEWFVLDAALDRATHAEREAVSGAVRKWLDEQDDDGFDYDEFVKGMNANRAGGRVPFPPELKGVTW